MRHGRQHRDIGAGCQREVMLRLDMRHAHQIDPARVDDDELCSRFSVFGPQPPFHPAGEDRMGIGGICAHHQDDIRLHDAVEILRACAGAEGGLEPVAGR